MNKFNMNVKNKKEYVFLIKKNFKEYIKTLKDYYTDFDYNKTVLEYYEKEILNIFKEAKNNGISFIDKKNKKNNIYNFILSALEKYNSSSPSDEIKNKMLIYLFTDINFKAKSDVNSYLDFNNFYFYNKSNMNIIEYFKNNFFYDKEYFYEEYVQLLDNENYRVFFNDEKNQKTFIESLNIYIKEEYFSFVCKHIMSFFTKENQELFINQYQQYFKLKNSDLTFFKEQYIISKLYNMEVLYNDSYTTLNHYDKWYNDLIKKEYKTNRKTIFQIIKYVKNNINELDNEKIKNIVIQDVKNHNYNSRFKDCKILYILKYITYNKHIKNIVEKNKFYELIENLCNAKLSFIKDLYEQCVFNKTIERRVNDVLSPLYNLKYEDIINYEKNLLKINILKNKKIVNKNKKL